MKRIIFVLLLLLASSEAVAWTVDSLTFTKRKKITIDNTYVDGDLTNFPLLVVLTSDSNVGAVCQTDGDDIRFTASDGSTLLNQEKESFSVSGGAATGRIWVKVPTVSGSSDTDIYMYYGNAGASQQTGASSTWDSNYVGVYHFNEGSGTTANSSTGSNNFTLSGSPSWGTSSLIFDGSDDRTDVITSSNNAFTVTAMAKRNNIAQAYATFFGWRADYAAIILYDTGNISFLNTSGNPLTTHSSVWTDEASFHYFSFRQQYTNATNKTRIINFDADAALSTGPADYDTMTSYRLGEFITIFANRYLVAEVQEFRVSSTDRSDNWVKFEYRNYFESDNEISFGTQETDGGGSVFSRRAFVI